MTNDNDKNFGDTLADAADDAAEYSGARAYETRYIPPVKPPAVAAAEAFAEGLAQERGVDVSVPLEFDDDEPPDGHVSGMGWGRKDDLPATPKDEGDALGQMLTPMGISDDELANMKLSGPMEKLVELFAQDPHKACVILMTRAQELKLYADELQSETKLLDERREGVEYHQLKLQEERAKLEIAKDDFLAKNEAFVREQRKAAGLAEHRTRDEILAARERDLQDYKLAGGLAGERGRVDAKMEEMQDKGRDAMAGMMARVAVDAIEQDQKAKADDKLTRPVGEDHKQRTGRYTPGSSEY